MTIIAHPDRLKGNRKQRRAYLQSLKRDVKKAQKKIKNSPEATVKVEP